MVGQVLAALASAVIAGSPPAQERLQVWAEGLIVTHVQTRGSAAAPVFDFTIQYSGQPERINRFFVSQATSITSVEVRRGLILVWGRNRAGHYTVDGIDGASGKSHFATVCSSFRLAPAQTRYLCDTPDGEQRNIDFATRRVTRVVATQQGVLSVLRSGPLQARRGIVQAFPRTLELQQDPVIRSALFDELQRAVSEDLQIAAQTSAKTRVRLSSQKRDYLGELISALAPMRDPRALPSLVRADHLRAASALVAFGLPAIRPILAALRQPSPPGVSIHQRAGNVGAVVRIVRGFPSGVPEDLRGEIVAVLPGLLDRPDSYRELLEAISLSAEVDEGSALAPRLRRIAQDRLFLASLGIADATESRQVQSAAQRALESHIVIR